MLKTTLKTLILSLTLTSLCHSANAQDAATGSSTGHFDLGVKTGSFLPYEVAGVRELLPIVGFKIGHSVSPTMALEYDIDIANAKGATYYLAYFSLRHDFAVGNVLPMFFLIGVDAHYFKGPAVYGDISGELILEREFQFSGGWHVSVGSETLVYGDIWIRADVRMGFSPGRQLTVSFAGIYRF